jgi:rubrerythrin
MSIRFNIDEVFVMAVKIEENGAAFYRRAAELHAGGDFETTLKDLADMEDEHKKIFTEMREQVGEDEKLEQAYDPFNEAVLYLNSMADYHGGEGSQSAADKLTGDETILDIVRTGIELEKKSILYYLGLKDLVPQRLGKEKMDKIIVEEKKHVVQLSKILTQEKKK